MPNASHVYYVRYGNYGQAGHMGYTLDNPPREIPGHVGGVMFCPRCASPLGVAMEQIEHLGEPCSVGHTGTHLLDVLAGSQTHKCGAHFKTGDPEETASWNDVPLPQGHWARTEYSTSPLFRRPIGWHGDV